MWKEKIRYLLATKTNAPLAGLVVLVLGSALVVSNSVHLKSIAEQRARVDELELRVVAAKEVVDIAEQKTALCRDTLKTSEQYGQLMSNFAEDVSGAAEDLDALFMEDSKKNVAMVNWLLDNAVFPGDKVDEATSRYANWKRHNDQAVSAYADLNKIVENILRSYTAQFNALKVN